MKRGVQAVLGIALAAVIVACSDDRANDANRNAGTAGTGAAVGTSGATADRDFVQDQLEDGRAEIALGKLAAEKATHPEVKEFAQRMVQEHQQAGDELRQAVASANTSVNPPAEPDGDHKNLQEELAKLSGHEFDVKYIDAMVDEHEEAVNELERKADSDNPQIKQWVAKTLPAVRQHLEHAKQLDKKLEERRSH